MLRVAALEHFGKEFVGVSTGLQVCAENPASRRLGRGVRRGRGWKSCCEELCKADTSGDGVPLKSGAHFCPPSRLLEVEQN